MIGVVRDELKFSAPRVEIGFALDVSQRIGNHRGGFEVVGEIVESAVRALAGDPLTVEEDVFVRFPLRSLSPTIPGVIYQ